MENEKVRFLSRKLGLLFGNKKCKVPPFFWELIRRERGGCF